MIRFAFLAALAVFLLPATSYAQNLSATWANNCGSKTRCIRVFNDIPTSNFCLNPGQSYTVYGLAYGSTYCAWCADARLPEDCRQWPICFD